MRDNLPGDWSRSAAGAANYVAQRGTETIALAQWGHTGGWVAIYSDSAITSHEQQRVVADFPNKEKVIDEVVEMMEEGYFDE